MSFLCWKLWFFVDVWLNLSSYRIFLGNYNACDRLVLCFLCLSLWTYRGNVASPLFSCNPWVCMWFLYQTRMNLSILSRSINISCKITREFSCYCSKSCSIFFFSRSMCSFSSISAVNKKNTLGDLYCCCRTWISQIDFASSIYEWEYFCYPMNFVFSVCCFIVFCKISQSHSCYCVKWWK